MTIANCVIHTTASVEPGPVQRCFSIYVLTLCRRQETLPVTIHSKLYTCRLGECWQGVPSMNGRLAPLAWLDLSGPDSKPGNANTSFVNMAFRTTILSGSSPRISVAVFWTVVTAEVNHRIVVDSAVLQQFDQVAHCSI